MIRYLGKAQNGMRLRPIGLLAWAVVACAVLWFSCCGGVP